MTYQEAIKAEYIPAELVKVEIEAKHRLSFSDFVKEHGFCSHYTGAEVLQWLGY